MIMMRSFLLAFFLLLVDIASAQTDTAVNNPFASELSSTTNNCTPCDGPVDATQSLDGVSCPEWLELARQIPHGTEECTLERLLGVQFCGCPTTSSEVCEFCTDSNTIEVTKQLPFSSIACDTFQKVPAVDGTVTCQVMDKFASYCGCSDTTVQCTLCADGRPPQYLDKPLYLGMTCADVQDLYSVSSDRQCGALDQDYPFDVQAYCGWYVS